MGLYFCIWFIILLNCVADCKKRVCTCGRFRAKAKPQIVNGVESKDGGFPFIVAIAKSESPTSIKLMCTGSIIHTNWVITAAHCFPTSFTTKVLFGTNSQTEFSFKNIADVLRVYNHPWFNKTMFLAYDISLLQMKNPFTFSNDVDRICLSRVSHYETALVSGFGLTKENGTRPPKLRETFVKNRDQVCTNLYRGDFSSTLQTCAEYQQRSTCNGDSGGPLFAITSKAVFLVGLVSWAEGCGRKDKPTVYTRVSAFTEWIAQITKGLGCYI